MRQMVREGIPRGTIAVKVNVQPGAAVPVQVNRDLLQAYAQSAEELRRQLGASSDLDVVSLLRLPGVIGGLAPPPPETGEEQGQLGKALEAWLREAFLKLDGMRHAEGRHPAEELRPAVRRIGQQPDPV